jgi:alanyl-tRNA synthetase
MTAAEIINKYIAFFEKRGHKRIPNSPLVPLNDPTTLFINSGMQPLVPYLLGEEHPLGTRLLNVQNVIRTIDIDEIGNSRHLTFYRMIGNWSLGDYFKKEQLPWIFEFLTDKEKGLGINPEKLYVTVFAGNDEIPKDIESITIWKELFGKVGIDAKENERIFHYDVTKNWWSRAGIPDNMPAGEPGGPSSEIFFDFGAELKFHEKSSFKDQLCHVNCDCGRYWEIGNSVFMQYQKQEDGSVKTLPKQNVDFGGGLERLLGAAEDIPDIFQTSLFTSIIKEIENQTDKLYEENKKSMQIIADPLVSSVFVVANGVLPSNKDRGYILRRLIRRSYDNFSQLGGKDISPLIKSVILQYKDTDPEITDKFESIKDAILEESRKYKVSQVNAKSFLLKKYKHIGDASKGAVEISAEDAFVIYTTHGLSPSQIKSLGYTFNEQEFAEKMKSHKDLSKKGSGQKFKGGLADHQERTIMGHTATHLMHQALRDMFGKQLHQTGSNITTERVRFDFNFERKLTDEEVEVLEKTVNEKIGDNLPVHFEMIPTEEAKKMGAIGLFDDTYQETSKIYFIGEGSDDPKEIYSIEFCGGPHVDFTGRLKSFKIIKQESLGQGHRRLYAIVG